MVGTVDRFIRLLGARAGVLECKTTNAFERHAWEEGAPLYYQIQLQHYMAVTGLPMGSFAVLIGGNAFRWYDVERNEPFIRTLEEKCQEFWRLVETETAPAVDHHKATGRALKALHPDDSGETVELPTKFADIAIRRQQLRDLGKQADDELEALDNEIRGALGSATYGIIPGVGQFSLKTQRRGEHIVKASQFRRLHWKAGK
jgi:predicted phage-related endonuclease